MIAIIFTGFTVEASPVPDPESELFAVSELFPESELFAESELFPEASLSPAVSSSALFFSVFTKSSAIFSVPLTV